jgi:hypothetical protein
LRVVAHRTVVKASQWDNLHAVRENWSMEERAAAMAEEEEEEARV